MSIKSILTLLPGILIFLLFIILMISMTIITVVLVSLIIIGVIYIAGFIIITMLGVVVNLILMIF